jgi:hypothetical protein
VAEAVVLVCDECGRPDATSITIRTGTGNYVKDLCDDHLKALIANTRAPRRGRPKRTRASKPSRSKATRGRHAGAKRTTARKRASRKSTKKSSASAK